MNTGMPVESPVRGDVHAGFGGRVGETKQPRGCHRAPARPYVFRFNRRKSRRRGLLFYRLMCLAADARPMTYDRIVWSRRGQASKVRGPKRKTPASQAKKTAMKTP